MLHLNSITAFTVMLCGYACMLSSGFAAAAGVPEDKIVRIAVIGGSTAADYDPGETNMRGWGQMLREHLVAGRGEIINAARGGRSSKSFRREGRWQAVLEEVPPPDYVLICFGSNDGRGKGDHRETFPGYVPMELPEDGLGSAADDWFRNNIHSYVEEAREAGIIPVVVTIQERSTFKDNGSVVRRNGPWSDAAIVAAVEAGAVVINLNAYSVELLETIGQEQSVRMQYIRDDGSVDRSHHNAVGAGLYAEYIASRLIAEFPELQDVLVDTQGSRLRDFMK